MRVEVSFVCSNLTFQQNDFSGRQSPPEKMRLSITIPVTGAFHFQKEFVMPNLGLHIDYLVKAGKQELELPRLRG